MACHTQTLAVLYWPNRLCKTWRLIPVFSKCVFPQRRPRKKLASLTGGWQASAQRKSLFRRKLKLAVYDASLMKGLSMMQKENEDLFSFSESRGRRRTQKTLRPARPPSKSFILCVNGNTRFRWPLVASSLRSDCYSSGPLGPSKLHISMDAQYKRLRWWPCWP